MYRLSKGILVFIFAILGLMTVAGGVLVWFTATARLAGMPVPLALAWLGVLAWVWYAYLRIPYEIIQHGDNTLEFRSCLKATVLSLHDIVAIKGMFMSPGFVKIKHTRGAMVLMTQMTGMHEFISSVKTANPHVEVSGC